MAEVVNMIALSPTMDEGTLAEWHVDEGDTVEDGQLLADVETDKATMELESWYDGTILKLVAQPGDAIAVGDPIAIVGDEGEDVSDLLEKVESGEAAAEPEPSAGEAADEPEQQEADEQPTEEPPAEEPGPEKDPAASTGSTDEGRLRASPLARRIAADEGIDLAAIEGSGPAGRIVKKDVEEFVEQGGAAPQSEAPSPAPTTDVPTSAGEIPGEDRPLSQMRKTIADRLTTSWNSAPHFMLTVDIDMEPAMAYRASVNERLESTDREVQLSVNDLIVKACAQALRNYPDVNVSYQGDHVRRFDEVHVGVAVAVDEGLVTPTIHHADRKSLSEISKEARQLAEKARGEGLEPEDYGGSTFTVSNLGMYGIEHFTAVINPPEAAILACGAVEERPVVEEGELAVGTRMKMTLSCDHRAVDGAMGAEFLGEVTELLENPMLLTV